MTHFEQNYELDNAIELKIRERGYIAACMCRQSYVRWIDFHRNFQNEKGSTKDDMKDELHFCFRLLFKDRYKGRSGASYTDGDGKKKSLTDIIIGYKLKDSSGEATCAWHCRHL